MANKKAHSDPTNSPIPEVAYFWRNREKIAKRYNRDFVAILDNAVVDSDANWGALEKRCDAVHGKGRVYIAYAAAMSLSELIERYLIEGDIDPERDRELWEAEAAKEALGE